MKIREKMPNKKRFFKALIAVILIICITLLAKSAWAKYIAQINGQATAQIAEMKFTINENYDKSTDKINFSSYRDDNNPKVAKDMLAPGTYGHVPITIDATGTQTSLEYEISIDLTNRPTNLKFYSDKAKTEEILIKNNKIIRRGYISINEENSPQIKHETIYWQWLTETGENRYEINENDIEDSKYMNKIMMMQINVKGFQIKEIPVYIGDVVNVNDTVSYKLSNGEVIDGIVVNNNDNCVEIMPIDSKKKAIVVGNVTLKGITGFNEAIVKINNAAISGYTLSKASRALNLADINRLNMYNPTSYELLTYNKTYSVDNATGKLEFIVGQQTIVNNSTIEATSLTKSDGTKIQPGDTITLGQKVGDVLIQDITINCAEGKYTNAYYSYNNTNEYFNKSFWLASRTYRLIENVCEYSVANYRAESNVVNRFSVVYASNGAVIEDFRATIGVVPVISLSATEHTKQIIDSNNPDKTIWEVIE